MENIHKYLRKLFALTPDESIIVFEQAIKAKNNQYLSVNRDSNFILYLAQKITYKIVLLIDFLGKLLFYQQKAQINKINPKCLNNNNINSVVNFCIQITK